MKLIPTLALALLALTSCSHLTDEDLAKVFDAGVYTAGRIFQEINAQK